MTRTQETGPSISVVVPVYRCTDCLGALHRRLTAALTAPAGFELVLVDDRGGEGAWQAILALAQRDPRVRGLRLTRNFGQDGAIAAGLAHARGDWVVVMDCDLQDPPEAIPRLLERALSDGVDVVFGVREGKPASLPRRLLARLYFKLLTRATGSEIAGEYGPFSVLSRSAVRAYVGSPVEGSRYLLVLHELGLSWSTAEYRPEPRHAGRSSYSLARLAAGAAGGGVLRAALARGPLRTLARRPPAAPAGPAFAVEATTQPRD